MTPHPPRAPRRWTRSRPAPRPPRARAPSRAPCRSGCAACDPRPRTTAACPAVRSRERVDAGRAAASVHGAAVYGDTHRSLPSISDATSRGRAARRLVGARHRVRRLGLDVSRDRDHGPDAAAPARGRTALLGRGDPPPRVDDRASWRRGRTPGTRRAARRGDRRAAALRGRQRDAAVAERTVPSGLAALIVASLPLWIVV